MFTTLLYKGGSVLLIAIYLADFIDTVGTAGFFTILCGIAGLHVFAWLVYRRCRATLLPHARTLPLP